MQTLANRAFPAALGKQQYVMTAVNNLALLLAESLNQMQQKSMSIKSSGKSGKSCPMPGQGKPSMKSMRQMQEQLNQQMENMKKSMEKGKSEQGKMGKSGTSEQYARMAAEQEALRRQLGEYRDQLQKEGKPILVHIHANWCPTCRAQSPIISSLLKQKDFQNLTSLRVDFDNQKDVVRAFHVSQQSTLIVFKGGKEVDRSLGDTTPSGIEKLLRKTL